MKSEDFLVMVKNDILRCDRYLKDNVDVMPFLNELIGKYSKVSKNFPEVEMNSIAIRIDPNIPRNNVHLIRGFLVAYISNDCQDYTFDKETDGSLSQNNNSEININISNKNENNIIVKSFDEAKKEIENMSSLPDEDIEEILEKVNQLEQIVNSNDRKSKKWSKAKELVKWVADKGVDVGIALLPLVLKIGQAQ